MGFDERFLLSLFRNLCETYSSLNVHTYSDFEDAVIANKEYLTIPCDVEFWWRMYMPAADADHNMVSYLFTLWNEMNMLQKEEEKLIKDIEGFIDDV
ncbi:hypothetical protein ACOME3_003514 [Neoechinorhynchus agilis]